MVIVRAPIHNYRVGDTRSFICYLCLDANPLESLRLHLYFIRSSHVPLSGRLSLTINPDKSFPSTPLRLWTRSSPWTTSSSASRKHRIWRRSSKVNDEERTTFYGTTLTNYDVKRFNGAKLGRDDRSALLAVQVRDWIYAGPRLQDDESLTEL